MSDDKYTTAAAGARRFFASVSSAAQTFSERLMYHGDRFGVLVQRPNPAQFDLVARESAADLEAFAQELERPLPSYRRNLELLTEGYEEKLKGLDPNTKAGAQELADMRREAGSLAQTATDVKAKVLALSAAVQTIQDGAAHPRTTQAAKKVLAAIVELFAAYEDMETFALRVGFAAKQKEE